MVFNGRKKTIFKMNVFDSAQFFFFIVAISFPELPKPPIIWIMRLSNANEMQRTNLMEKSSSKRYFHGRFWFVCNEWFSNVVFLFCCLKASISIYAVDLQFDYKINVFESIFLFRWIFSHHKSRNCFYWMLKIDSVEFWWNQSFRFGRVQRRTIRDNELARWLNDLSRHHAYLSETIPMFWIVTLDYSFVFSSPVVVLTSATVLLRWAHTQNEWEQKRLCAFTTSSPNTKKKFRTLLC